ncbi:DUF2917 domain-containing protein [Xenophilus sp. Marseille-Q4582]|uniref:DUF2917 domain-containing protein n=1 Tax=Xenophilus sp. Marseille-Q4582 TaxID=2866600 RepID=UPI001CE49962|nr:DUF2917 domain-containing protein [Xenophilus sp. Marseille-Q4582]
MANRPALADFHLELPRQGLLTLPDVAGIGIECRHGSVWVTLDHDPRDIVLAPGERFVGDAHRRALVSALEPASLTVSQARPAAWPPCGRPAALARRPWRIPRGWAPA